MGKETYQVRCTNYLFLTKSINHLILPFNNLFPPTNAHHIRGGGCWWIFVVVVVVVVLEIVVVIDRRHHHIAHRRRRVSLLLLLMQQQLVAGLLRLTLIRMKIIHEWWRRRRLRLRLSHRLPLMWEIIMSSVGTVSFLADKSLEVHTMARILLLGFYRHHRRWMRWVDEDVGHYHHTILLLLFWWSQQKQPIIEVSNDNANMIILLWLRRMTWIELLDEIERWIS